MSILVKELFENKLMKNSIILSGENGLNRKIQRISVYDCPVRKDVLERKILRNGDFLITSLFFQKSSITMIKEFIKILNDSGCSGICVSNQYIESLPREALDYSNKIGFPIILFDRSIPYADIIKTTMELIIVKQMDIVNELRVEKLLKENLLSSEIRELAFEINTYFKEYNCALCIEGKEFKEGQLSARALIDNLNLRQEYAAFYYKKSILVILSFNTENNKVIKSNIKMVIKEIEKYYKNYNIGISEIHTSINNLNETITEALFSLKNSKFFRERISYYSEMGVNRILLPIQGHKEMEKFYNMIISPLKIYDERFNSEILKTVISFLRNNGNYKKTAEEFYQHQNTIRNRIKTAKSILNMENNDFEFYTNILLAIKIGILLNDELIDSYNLQNYEDK